jgi:PKD repeat protein
LNEPLAFSVLGFNYPFSCASHTFQWQFGDGGTATGQNVTHTYTSTNTFPVKVTVSNGSQSFEATATARIAGSNQGQLDLMVDFSVTRSNPTGNTYIFNPSASPTGVVKKWMWDFGDGTTRTISKEDGRTEYTYGDAGSYNVTLKAFDSTTATVEKASKTRKNEPTTPPKRRAAGRR